MAISSSTKLIPRSYRLTARTEASRSPSSHHNSKTLWLTHPKLIRRIRELAALPPTDRDQRHHPVHPHLATPSGQLSQDRLGPLACIMLGQSRHRTDVPQAVGTIAGASGVDTVVCTGLPAQRIGAQTLRHLRGGDDGLRAHLGVLVLLETEQLQTGHAK